MKSKGQKRVDRYLKKMIASDKYNLLRDNESRIGYFLLRIRYKLELLITNKNK